MTMEIGSTRRTGAVGFGSTESVDGVNASAPEVDLPVIDGAASEAEVRAFLESAGGRLNEYVAQLGDPETALMALSNLVERSGMQVNREQVNGQQQLRQAHLAKQAEAAKKAAEDQKTSATWGLFAKIASYIGAVVGVVAGVAVAAVTGGAGLVGVAAIIGAVASGVGLGAQATGDAAQELLRNDPTAARNLNGALQIGSAVLGLASAIVGIIANPLNALRVVGNSVAIAGQVGAGCMQALQLARVEVPGWLGAVFSALAVAGAGVAGGAGGASSSGATLSAAAGRAASALRLTSGITQGASSLTAGAGGMVSACLTNSADVQRIEARQQGQAARRALESLEELSEQLRDLAESLNRERGRALEMVTDRSHASTNIARNFVRA